MNFMKKNWGILTGIILIFSCLFYWYSYRPAQIRKSCNNSAFLESMKDSTDFGGNSEFSSVGQRLDVKDKLYRDCLRYNGIEK